MQGNIERPFIEFFHSGDMPWEKNINFLNKSNVEYKVLSKSLCNNEFSLIIKFPINYNFKLDNADYDEEFFVLNGSIEIEDTRYYKGCYAFFPSGYLNDNLIKSDDGAEILTFITYKGEKSFNYDESRLIKYISLYKDGWDENYDGINSPEIASSGSRKKLLRTDLKTGDQSWIMGVIPSYQESKVESHPVVQECFIINGEIDGNRGKLIEGSYFWRPKDILHGPYGSKTGCTIFSRSIGGKLIVDYYDCIKPFNYNSIHRVDVPNNLINFSQPKSNKIKF
ncbi:DUF4437 domain-containing protein [Alphaproteobacteria bacterium]|nr:DUF4437 domain-containing protein [Alphaproteobacteria bacterium]